VRVALFLSLIPAFFGDCYRSSILEREPRHAQQAPTWISRQADRGWRRIATHLIDELKPERERLEKQLKRELAQLADPPDLEDPTHTELALEGTYGQVPEVLVDQGHGTVFPIPIQSPGRYSWYQLGLQARRALRILRAIDRKFASGVTAAQLAGEWNDFSLLWLSMIQQKRYLEAWIPELERQGFKPPHAMIVEALLSGDHRLIEPLRELLKPRRIMKRAYIPDDLEQVPGHGWITLPIVTDVTDKRFLAEVEGAIQTHWNQSPWARDMNLRFKVQWKRISPNPRFLKTEQIFEHLERFPKDMAGMTTGGLTTHVRGTVLILGPGKTSPRTLAHEVGHLIGFGDCYLRTLSSQGLYGNAVLEWDNPIYPDDLMCDNTVGVPRVEVW